MDGRRGRPHWRFRITSIQFLLYGAGTLWRGDKSITFGMPPNVSEVCIPNVIGVTPCLPLKEPNARGEGQNVRYAQCSGRGRSRALRARGVGGRVAGKRGGVSANCHAAQVGRGVEGVRAGQGGEARAGEAERMRGRGGRVTAPNRVLEWGEGA